MEKLERFLNEFEGENLPINGIYEQIDFEAVSRFQEKYLGDILSPWSHNKATGYVYITTKKKINEIYCQRAFPLTPEQEAEVSSFSKRFLDIFTGDATASTDTEDPTPEDTSEGYETEDEEDVSGRVGGVQDETDEDENGDEAAKDETEDETEDKPEEDQKPDDKPDDKTDEDTDEDTAVTEDDQEEDKTSGSEYANYLLWAAAIMIIAGVVWYYWPKKKKEDSE